MVHVEVVMIDLEIVRQLAVDYWTRNIPLGRLCPPEAKFVTGDQETDALLHYFEIESGLTLQLSKDHTYIAGFDVVDEKKLMWFTLEWS